MLEFAWYANSIIMPFEEHRAIMQARNGQVQELAHVYRGHAGSAASC